MNGLSVYTAHLPVHCMGLPHPDLPDNPKDVHCSLSLQALKNIGHSTESSRATRGTTLGREGHKT